MGKGGKQSRKDSRKKEERKKNINEKKKKKREIRMKIIKDRGDLCTISPLSVEVLAMKTPESIINPNRTLSTPAEVNMIVSTYCQSVRKKVKQSGSGMDRVHKCKTSICNFMLRYKAKLVAVNDHGILLEDQKQNESNKEIRYVRTKYSSHSCSAVTETKFGTFYTDRQLAPTLVKLSKNSTLPNYDCCKIALGKFVHGEVKRKLIENVRKAAKEMMGTGTTADSISLMPSLFRKINELGHKGEIQTSNAKQMRKLVIENEKKVHEQQQKSVVEEKRTEFKLDERKVNKFVPDKEYMTGFTLVPSHAINCADRMSFISTSDACHITHRNINGINLYTTCHDANYQINPMIASYSLFEESLKTWNVHNEVDFRLFPKRNTPDHVHICDGDKGGHAS